MALLLRKTRSFLAYLAEIIIRGYHYLSYFGNLDINVGKGCTFGKRVVLRATDGGKIVLGRGVHVSDNVKMVVQGGIVIIEDDVFIGVGAVIVCRESIFIGRDSLISEYVVIRDQDHNTRARPIKDAGFLTSPIHIGSDVWVGCKATILRGSVVGARCVVGAHALVNSCINEDMLVVGVPARAIRNVSSDR